MQVQKIVENPQCNLNMKIYSRSDLKRMLSGKNIYVWGVGLKGRGIFHALRRNGFNVTAFLDKSPLFRGGGGV